MKLRQIAKNQLTQGLKSAKKGALEVKPAAPACEPLPARWREGVEMLAQRWTAAVAAAASSHGLQYQVAALKPLKLSCMTVPPFDLSVQLSDLGDDLEHAVLDVLRSGQYIGGPQIQRFEKAFATSADCDDEMRRVCAAAREAQRPDPVTRSSAARLSRDFTARRSSVTNTSVGARRLAMRARGSAPRSAAGRRLSMLEVAAARRPPGSRL